MISLAPLFKNFFADSNHSFVELSRYGNAHLLRLSANNPGNVLDDVIAEVSAANTAFAACLGDEEALAAARQSANEARDNLRKSMSGPAGAVSRASAAVQAAYGKPSPDYTACFPEGVEGITKAANVQMEEKLENLRAALSARSAQVGAAHVTAITNLKASWVALKNAAGTASGAESAGEEHRAECREALARALSRSALWLAWHFNGQEGKFDLYCPVHLLKNPEPTTVPGGAQVTSLEGGTGEWTGTAEAEGATVMRWFTRPAGASEDFTEAGTSAPGEEFTKTGVASGSHEVKVQGENSAGVGTQSEVSVISVS